MDSRPVFQWQLTSVFFNPTAGQLWFCNGRSVMGSNFGKDWNSPN